MIPQSFIQDLLARTDIVDLIGQYVPLKKSGANFFACCPFHDEKSASFSVSPSKQFYHCFGCGAHGSAIGFLMQYSGLGFAEAVEQIAGQAGLQVPDDGRSRAGGQQRHEPALTDMLATAAAHFRARLRDSQRAVDYLKGRGLTGRIAQRYGIGYAPAGWQTLAEAFPDYQDPRLLEAGLVIENDQGRRYDRFRDRIMFPIHDPRGNVIGFGGRIIDKGEPKYMNSPETPVFEKGRELYGLLQARDAIRNHGVAVVVEGYMDVISLAQFGVDNAVATLGTATTPNHVQRLLRTAERVVFCFDGDAAGRRAAWRALDATLEHLRDDRNVGFLFLPAEHDPDSFVRAEGAQAFIDRAASATPLATLLEEQLAEDIDFETAEGRARYAHSARPLVTRIAAPLLRLQVLKRIAERSGLSQAELEQSYGLDEPAREPTGKTTAVAPRRSRPVARQRRAARPPEDTLLRMVLLHPRLVSRIRSDGIPSASEAGRALLALIDADGLGELPTRGGIGALLEYFRDTPHEQTLREIAASTDENLFEESALEALFSDTLHKLHEIALVAEFTALQASLNSGGRLSPEQLKRYGELLRERQAGSGRHKQQDS
ncbi:MAG: DNA primase [Rhodocyclaceae bacterium]|nr:DNA primase [Rhodocyclaceae bacterium]